MKTLLPTLLVLCALKSGAQQTIRFTLQVNQPPLLIADAGEAINTSGNEFSLGANPTASGGTAPYTYSWTPANQFGDPTLANPTVQANQSGYFHVLVTDSRSCSATDSVLITLTDLDGSTPNHSFRIYQAGAQLLIEQDSEQHYAISGAYLSDLSGRIYASQTAMAAQQNFKLDIPQVPAGNYILVIGTEKGPVRKTISILNR